MNWLQKTNSRAITLPPEVLDQIDPLLSKLQMMNQRFVQNSPEDSEFFFQHYLKNIEEKRGRNILVDFLDLPIGTVSVYFNPTYKGTSAGQYFPASKSITISPHSTDGGAEIWETLRHEIIHALDPKFAPDSKYKYPDSYNNREEEYGREYHVSPHEFDARTGELVGKLQGVIKNDIGGFMEGYMNLESAYSFLDKIRGEISQGSVASLAELIGKGSLTGALEFWKEDPRLWRKMLQRIANGIKDAENSLRQAEYSYKNQSPSMVASRIGSVIIK